MDTVVPGALAAFVVDCSIFPLDTVKSRIQSADFKTRYPGGQGLYKGLWQGFGPVVVATLPSAAIFFTTYENAKEVLTSPTAPLIGPLVARDARAAAVAHTCSSALAELAACLVLTPAETIKQQRQVARSGASASTTAALWQNVSLPSLWRGYWALVGRNLPFTAMQFPMYEFFRRHLARATGLRPRHRVRRAGHQEEPERRDDVDASQRARKEAFQVQQRTKRAMERHPFDPPSETLPTATQHYVKAGLVSGASAGCAGAISALITTPLDLVKTRIMLDSSPHQKSSTQLLTSIWKSEGLHGLMRGGLIRSVWTALGAGIYLGSYEAGREWWRDAGKEQAKEVADKAHELVDDVRSST